MEVVKTIRPRITLIAAIGASVVSAVAIGSVVASHNFAQITGVLCTLGIIDLIVWLLFVEPKIKYDTQGLVIVNPLRIFQADWAAIEKFDTRYGLAAVVGDKKFTAWSAPAPGRREVAKVNARDFRGTPMQGEAFVEPGRIHYVESGKAFWLLDAVRQESTGQTRNVKTSPNWRGLASLVAIALLTYLNLHV